MDNSFLISKSQYDTLHPAKQGYLSFMQAAYPENMLPLNNPHPPDSVKHLQWARGYKKAKGDYAGAVNNAKNGGGA